MDKADRPPFPHKIEPLDSPGQNLCELSQVMQIVMRVGVMMLRSGTVSFRVEQAMQRIAIALGAERLDAYVTLTGITASIHRGDLHYTQIARVKNVGVNMARLGAVEYLSQHIPANASPTMLVAHLDKIEQTPNLYPMPLIMLLVAVACGAFASLNGGGLVEFAAAAIGSGAGQTLKGYLQQIQLNQIAATIICAAIATLLCCLTLHGLTFIGLILTSPQAGFLASVLFLVPGTPLVTAALDLVRLDLVSGISRLTYAALLLFSVAIGILLVTPLTGQTVL